MQLEGKTIVLTGAAGGMGELIAIALAERGAQLLITDINADKLATLSAALGGQHIDLAADLTTAEGRDQLINACRDLQNIDVLINAAGMSDYSLLSDLAPEKLQIMLDVNLVAPMLLCQALAPLLAKRPEAAILNMGSTFGSIGHAGFATYCASKFGLRGFTEALRRELADTNVAVFYLAPRATQTDINSAAVIELNQQLGNTMDEPEVVVASLLQVLSNGKSGDYFLGWPEKLFVRVNGLLPKVVDNAMNKSLATIKRLAS
jgi:short-subunit dehydrogenase